MTKRVRIEQVEIEQTPDTYIVHFYANGESMSVAVRTKAKAEKLKKILEEH